MMPPRARHVEARGTANGLTILECLLATAILTIAGLSVTYVLSAGRSRFGYSDQLLHATRLGEHLLEEVTAKPYFGSGADRATWSIPDYNGFIENAGGLVDALGRAYPAEDQKYQRAARVEDSIVVVPELDNFAIPGKVVTVRVESSPGNARELSRFISEPIP